MDDDDDDEDDEANADAWKDGMNVARANGDFPPAADVLPQVRNVVEAIDCNRKSPVFIFALLSQAEVKQADDRRSVAGSLYKLFGPSYYLAHCFVLYHTVAVGSSKSGRAGAGGRKKNLSCPLSVIAGRNAERSHRHERLKLH